MVEWTVALGVALLAAVALAAWAIILAQAIGFYRGHPTVRPQPGDTAAVGDVLVTVIVPANNEAAHLEECLRSILAQGHTQLELIVVDDRSTDSTRTIAHRVAADDARVRVLHVDAVAAGWTGKTHALHRGAAVANGSWLLFTDADTIHQPGCLAACLRYAVDRQLDLFSGWPAAAPPTLTGGLTAPMCGAVLASWFRKQGPGQRGFAPFANGQFLLIRAAAYRELGGHTVVRGDLLEDIALARKVARDGRSFEVVLLHQVLRVHAYATWAECWSGWPRLFLEGARRSTRRLRRIAIVLPVLAVAGYLAAACGLVAWCVGGASLPWTAAVATGVLAVVAMTLSVGFVSHHARVAPAYALLAPLSALLTAALLGSAIRSARTNRALEWHGVRYLPRHEPDHPG